MSSKVILKKQRKGDIDGHLVIQHFHYGERKIISLKKKISEEHYLTYFEPEFQRFRRTSVIDYEAFNRLIKKNIGDLSCFGVVENNNISFIEYFKKNIAIQTNPSTIQVRNSVLNKIEEFELTKKKYKGIPFSIIDYFFIIGLKNFIQIKCAGSTTKAYMDVIKSVLNRAKLDLLYIEKYDYFKKIDYKIIGFDNSALPKEIVQKLLEIEHDKNIYELRMFLIAIFLHGIRISDLLLLKNEDFKKDKIFYVSKKSKKDMTVRYDDKLVTLLSKILSIPLVEETHSLNVEIDKILAFEDGNLKNVDITKEYTERQNNKNKFYGGTQRLIAHTQSLPKKEYFFKKIMDKEPLLGKYDKRKDMTEVQKKAYTRLVVYYNSILGKIAKKYDIEKMTSHTSRYTFANLSLGVPTPDINAISNALGHSSVKTTIDYFNKNFGKERVEKLGKEFNSEFLL